MGITVNTNMQAIRIQNNLNNSTKKMNTAMERMSSGYKINSSKDDATGYAVSATLQRNLSGTKVAMSNVSLADDMLSTAEGALSVIQSNMQRVRDLTEQVANGTYSQSDVSGAVAEIEERLMQVYNVATNTTFNGTNLFKAQDVRLQTGVNASDSMTLSGSTASSITRGTGAIQNGSLFSKVIEIDTSGTAPHHVKANSLFENIADFTVSASGDVSITATAGTLFGDIKTFATAGTPTSAMRDNIASYLTDKWDTTPTGGSRNYKTGIDAVLNDVNNRITNIGATSERLNAISETLNVTKENLTSALSTVRDADIAEESANFVQQQILQSASATLLTQANSAPQIALTLIQG